MELRRYAAQSALDDERKIADAKTRLIGHTKEQVLDKLFGMRQLGLTRSTIDAGYDAVIQSQDGAPETVWGMVQGLTRHSQSIPYADHRVMIDRAAGKLMEANF
jgi:hypothetical protein